MILSCSSTLIPIEISASRVPQSGQIAVALSSLDSAGLPRYSLPHFGQIRNVLSGVSILHTSLACFDCCAYILCVESEIFIPRFAHPNIEFGRHPKRAFLVHDVNKCINFLLGFFQCNLHVLFVVERRVPFVNMQLALERLIYFPRSNRYH